MRFTTSLRIFFTAVISWDGTYWEPFADVLEIIPMADGLWALGQGDVDLMDGEKFLETLPEASETFLVRIPEP